ncbi:MAG: hypothetical protein GY898_28375 [Proteobacteria bacterium]|nr:hypothetical protein [Pseudomonadota bacterium]
MNDDLHPTIERLGRVDLIDTAAYDDAFFDGLADAVMGRIEAGSTESKVLELPRRRAPRWFAAAAALAAVLVAGVMLNRAPVEPAPAPAIADADPLTTLGAELGRDLLAEVTADPTPAEATLATALTVEDLLDGAEDDDLYASWSLHDELDDLSAAELQSIITRL